MGTTEQTPLRREGGAGEQDQLLEEFGAGSPPGPATGYKNTVQPAEASLGKRQWFKTTIVAIALLGVCLIGGVIIRNRSDNSENQKAAYSSGGDEYPAAVVPDVASLRPGNFKSCLDYTDDEKTQLEQWRTDFESFMEHDEFFEWFTSLPDFESTDDDGTDGFCMLSASNDDEGRRLSTRGGFEDVDSCDYFSGGLSGPIGVESTGMTCSMNGTCCANADMDDDYWWQTCAADVNAHVRIIRVGNVLCVGLAAMCTSELDISDNCNISAALGGDMSFKLKMRYNSVTYKKVLTLEKVHTEEADTSEIVFTKTKSIFFITFTIDLIFTNEAGCEFNEWEVYASFSWSTWWGSNTVTVDLGTLDFLSDDDD